VSMVTTRPTSTYLASIPEPRVVRPATELSRGKVYYYRLSVLICILETSLKFYPDSEIFHSKRIKVLKYVAVCCNT